MKSTLYLLASFIILMFALYSCNKTANPVVSGEDVTFQGVLQDVQGHNIIGAIINALDTKGTIIASDTTNEEGSFSLVIEDIAIPELIVNVNHSDYTPYSSKLEEFTEQILKEEKVNLMMENDDECCGIINITVSDKDDESALEGVEVRLNRGEKKLKKEKTDRDGKLQFLNVCSGEYWVRLALDDYRVIEQELNLEDCDTVNLSFNMESTQSEEDTCCKSVLKIDVTDSESGDELNGALVRLWKDGELIEKAEVKEGKAVFDGLCEGKYGVDITKEGYKGIEFNIEFDCNETVEVEKELQKEENKECCDGIIKVVVKDKETGEYIENAKVKLWKEGKIFETAEVKDSMAVFDSLCEGKYGVSIQAEGYSAIEFNIELGCDEEAITVKELESKEDCCNGRIAVFPKDGETGENLNGAIVKLHKDGKVVRELKVEDGKAVFEELCEGKYAVTVHMEGYNSIEFHVEMDCNGNKEFTKEMESKSNEECCDGRVEIIIKDKETGGTIHDALVKLWKDGKLFKKIETDNGKVVFEDLCEGKYGVSVIKEGYEGFEFDFELDCNDSLKFEKELEAQNNDCCEGILKVYAKDSVSGEYIKYGKVKLWKNGKLMETASINDNGYAVFDGLCEGEYGVDILIEGYKHIEFAVVIDCNETEEVIKELTAEENKECCTAVLKLIIRDKSDESKIEGATVKIYLDDVMIADGESNGDGIFIKEKLCAPNKYIIVITKDGYNDVEFDWTFEKCQKFQETVNMTK